MHADALNLEELLELDPDGGVIRFAGQRALLLDAVAMGLLRKYLVENFGVAAARTVLTQFGFAHGWRMAEAMQAEFQWDSDEDWRRRHAHPLPRGVVPRRARGRGPAVERGRDAGRVVRGGAAPAALRPRRRAVCWTICGLMSGYISRTRAKRSTCSRTAAPAGATPRAT
jgi:two-component system response regulator HydG